MAEDLEFDVAAVVCNSVTKDLLLELLRGNGQLRCDVWQGRLGDAIEKFQNSKSPPTLIVDISNELSPISELERLAKTCTPDVNVVVIGEQDSISLYRDIMALGVSDYLVKPLSRDLFFNALQKEPARYPAEHAEARSGKTIAIFGVRGGVGATTIVANIGWVFSSIFDQKVILADYNLCNGSLSLDMGLTSSSAFYELLMDPSRIDEVFVKRATSTSGKKLDVLCTDGGFDRSSIVSAESQTRLLEILRSQYEFIVQDLQRSPFEGAIGMLDAADVRILVINKTLAALRDCGRILSKLTPGQSNQNLVVLNNTTRSTRNEVPVEKIRSFIKQPVDLIIPYEKYVMATAHLQGEIAAKNRGPVQDAYKELAGKIVGSSAVPPKTKNWLTAVTGW
ncbi:hypothetical protein NBZ79_08605 [Sneathiella marina]|uniref:Response regulatory domain-containing protein n=1 Tax=Sneathiella marina TaxID=2950108 RepID=A0ABY4WA72_9PROT|nr:AAA family ATPase [Sneathiella marina]USG63038.1 hypothetical protein NBZ79_08605 [Sneathiella marina]